MYLCDMGEKGIKKPTMFDHSPDMLVPSPVLVQRGRCASPGFPSPRLIQGTRLQLGIAIPSYSCSRAYRLATRDVGRIVARHVVP